ncbi:PIN domain-containing protein [Nonomuraea sp. KC401]|uniref:PIN domain-containing protein n=1 Tax=unclassified Nonomuraea TaxID=2593643 RepID=UPI0010FD014D|nr:MULTISPECIES: PIN domain-containing protein [unclassified Nonomuraea]NBE97058.1 PIN domain-containing protein [Nonomuraea sp. K271]TLF66201.1 PIN domain-containing protein [Nonomuraea sp. KC401]
MPFVVIYDANALFGNTQRDLLIRLAQSGLVQAKWTHAILDEVQRNLAANLPDLAPAKLERLRELMIDAVPDCIVEGYEPIVEGLKLPDPDDRHVLAAAIKANAQVIVTSNLRDFPVETLATWGVDAKSPDDFVLDQIDFDDRVVWACVQQIADSRTRPPQTIYDVLDALERAGLVEAVAALRS